MAQFPDLPRPNATLSELIKAGRAGASGSGVAGAHAIGSAFARKNLGFLTPWLDQYGIGINASPNGALFPDNMRGGATLGLANHANQLA
jgi:hypothetical protein